MRKIIENKIKCSFCGDIIESVHRHDYKECKCGKVSVDGGKDYLRRSFPSGYQPEESYTDLSTFEEVEL